MSRKYSMDGFRGFILGLTPVVCMYVWNWKVGLAWTVLVLFSVHGKDQ